MHLAEVYPPQMWFRYNLIFPQEVNQLWKNASNSSNNFFHTQHFPELWEVWLTYPQLKSE